MLISREVDYAIRIIHLLCENNRKMDAKEISQLSGISIRFTLKILGKLTTSNIIVSYRGAKGGYKVALSPSDITVYNIIIVLEGGLKINGCFDNKTSCSIEKQTICGLKNRLAKIEKKLIKELQNLTIDKLKGCSAK